MRVMAADGCGAGESFADVFLVAGPAIAAITSISPADACALAAHLSLRYAVQCWDDQEAGKAIFWKPAIAVQGLYRTEFHDRSGRAALEPHGLLRVTFLWDGRPLDVLCAHLSVARDQADWEMVQIGRELNAAGRTLLTVGPAGGSAPAWPGFVDAWSAARWRWIAYPSSFDIGDAARASFGVPGTSTATALQNPADSMRGSPLRLYCSDDFAVLGATYRPRIGSRDPNGPLIADLAPEVNGGPIDGADASARPASPREAVG